VSDYAPSIGGINWAEPGAEPRHATRATWAISDDWLVVATLANTAVADVRAFGVVCVDDDGAVVYRFDEDDGHGGGTLDLSKAIVQLTGDVTWDGCQNLTIGEANCMMHFCGPAAATMRDLLAMVYATARVALGDGWDGEADDTEPAVVVHRWDAACG
jgi:hypothetical protein